MAHPGLDLTTPPAASSATPAAVPPLARWLPAACGAVYLVLGLSSPAIFVDFFGFLARADDLPGKWLDGFYPTGYPLVLRGLYSLIGDYRLAGTILSAASACAVLAAAFRIGSQLGGNAAAGIAAQLLLAVNPHFVYWAWLGGTDMPTLACVAWSAAWLLRDDGRRSAFLAGLLMGAGYLARYTVLATAAGALVWLLVLRGQRARAVPFLGGVIMGAMPQWLPSLIITGSPLWNTQAKNIWFGLHGFPDWDRAWGKAPDTIPLSRVIAANADRLPAHWARNVVTGWQVIWATDGPIALGMAAVALAAPWWVRCQRWRWSGMGLLLALGAATVAATALAFILPRLLLVPAMLLLLVAGAAVGLGRASGAWAVRATLAAAIVSSGQGLLYRSQRMHPRSALYLPVASILHGAGMRSPLEVAALTAADGDFFYDPDDRRKIPFLPLPLRDGDVDELRREMGARGKRFLVVESACRQVYPRLGRLLEETTPPPGFTRLALWRLPGRWGWGPHEVAVYLLGPPARG